VTPAHNDISIRAAPVHRTVDLCVERHERIRAVLRWPEERDGRRYVRAFGRGSLSGD
jgi:hypothetical protein